MPEPLIPPLPVDAQVNQDEWEAFFRTFGHRTYRRVVRAVSRLPRDPRCEACGSPFAGWGGTVMRSIGKAPSRKNPRWCRRCFEMAPAGGAVLRIGVLFADVRGFTAMGEREAPAALAARMNRFYGDATRLIVRHGLVDKLIGDEIMGLYVPVLAPEGRFVDAMVADARQLLEVVGSGEDAEAAGLAVGVGLDVGDAWVGVVGEGEVRDFTAIGDPVNVAARLQAKAAAGQIVMSAAVAEAAGVTDGVSRRLALRGRTEPVSVRVVTVTERATGPP